GMERRPLDWRLHVYLARSSDIDHRF
ncbi:hypothetical protein CCACVL1_30228, partial [Corchorus capsularis]